MGRLRILKALRSDQSARRGARRAENDTAKLLAEANAAFDFEEPGMVAYSAEVGPVLEVDEVGFAARTSNIESIEGKIEFAEAVVSNNEGDVRYINGLRELPKSSKRARIHGAPNRMTILPAQVVLNRQRQVAGA